MRKPFLASFSALLALTGIVLADPPAPKTPTTAGDSGSASTAPDIAKKKAVKADKNPSAESDSSWSLSEKVLPFFEDSGAGDSSATVWADLEAIWWWTKQDRVPPLVTAGTQQSRGILGQPGTTTLIGDRGIGGDSHLGSRLTLGTWIDECHSIGLEGNFFFVDSHAEHYTAGATDAATAPVIAIPFFNITLNAPDSNLVAFPGIVSGFTKVSYTTRFQGAEANVVENLYVGDDFRLDLLGGFRYFEIDESININTSQTNDVMVGGNTITFFDQFGTRNRFYAGQVGLKGESRWDRTYFRWQTKLAVGSNRESVNISGATVNSIPGGGTPRVFPGGIFALPTNIGRFSHDQFAILPELNLRVGYHFTDRLNAYVGYDVLYLSDLARPGAQIDPVVNTTQLAGAGPLTGPSRPRFTFRDKDFSANGFNFGIEINY